MKMSALWRASRKFQIITLCLMGLFSMSVQVHAADPPGQTTSTVSDALSSTGSAANASQTASNQSNPVAQVVVNSITGSGSSYKMPPNAPSISGFAGGPCTGVTTGGSGAIAGLSLGMGRSETDDSCQRRNWIQTLLGAAQHMSPEDSAFMTRLAVEVMRDDAYLSGPFQRLGVASPSATGKSIAASFVGNAPKPVQAQQRSAVKISAPKLAADHVSKSCLVVGAETMPASVKTLFAARGCQILVK